MHVLALVSGKANTTKLHEGALLATLWSKGFHFGIRRCGGVRLGYYWSFTDEAGRHVRHAKLKYGASALAAAAPPAAAFHGQR